MNSKKELTRSRSNGVGSRLRVKKMCKRSLVLNRIWKRLRLDSRLRQGFCKYRTISIAASWSSCFKSWVRRNCPSWQHSVLLGSICTNFTFQCQSAEDDSRTFTTERSRGILSFGSERCNGSIKMNLFKIRACFYHRVVNFRWYAKQWRGNPKTQRVQRRLVNYRCAGETLTDLSGAQLL